MKKIFAAIVVAISVIAASPLSASTLNSAATLSDQRAASPQPIDSTAPQFARVIDDLPLPPGLELRPEEDLLFDEPGSGRIAETVAEGPVDIDDVYHFYRKSLPPLGWELIDERTYKREAEVLRIDAHATGKVTTVHFSVKPGKAK